MKKLILLFLFLCTITLTFAQNKITGNISDADGDPLIGASVVVDGTSIGTITDIDGNFSMETSLSGAQDLIISYVGYSTKKMSVNIEDGSTMLGNMTLSNTSVGLDEIVITGVMDIVKDRRTPVAVSTITREDIQAKSVGNVEFAEVMKNTPSVYVAQQTGFGDSQMFLRGFSQTNTAFLLNGQPINGMEDGRMYWSNWSGMSDVANAVQVQRGLGSSKLAISSVGGTINIVTKTIDKKEGGFVRFMYGNDNYLKGSLSYNSGLKGKWAFSIFVDHWQADAKWADGTNGQGQNYFMSVGYKPSENHTVNFLVTGAPQWHGQRWSQSLETLEETPRFNQHWGEYDGNFETERRNFYHKPVLNLSWDWDLNTTSKLSTVAYASFGRGGGTGNYGSSSNRIRTEDGQVDWDAIATNNSADDDGIGTFSDNYALRGSMNNHAWYGNVTKYEKDINENLNFSGGFDLRLYRGDHFRQLIDLFGLNGYNDAFRHSTRPSDYVVNSTFDARPWAALFNFASEEERIAYDYSENINYQGLFSQIEYTSGQLTTFVQGALSTQSYQREGRWQDIGKSDKVSKAGYNLKGGASYAINDNNTLFVNAGHYSRQPYLDNIFEDVRNSNTLLTPDVENEKITGIEAGYKLLSDDMRANFNVYHTTWGNRTNVSSFNNDGGTPDNEDDDFQQRDIERGISQTHMGVELDLQYKITDKIRLSGFTSLGDWTFNKIESLTSFNDDTGTQISEVEGDDIDDVHITSAPQFSLGFGVNAEVSDGFRVYADYNYFDKIYQRGRDDILREDIGTLDPYGVLDFGLNYSLDAGASTVIFGFNIYNVLDSDAINQTDRFGFFALNGRTYNVSAKYSF